MVGNVIGAALVLKLCVLMCRALGHLARQEDVTRVVGALQGRFGRKARLDIH